MKLKIILFIATIAALFSMSYFIKIQSNTIDKLQTEIKIANNNYSALENENNNLKEKNLTFELNVTQLNNSKDSLVQEMNKVRKELKVKDKELKELAYIASTANTKDSIFITNTIKVIEPIDTTLSDEWHSVNLQIDSSKLNVNTSYKSELFITTYLRKEIEHPSRCKLFNIFKKRNNVLEVEVLEKNPYIINNKEKFIKVL